MRSASRCRVVISGRFVLSGRGPVRAWLPAAGPNPPSLLLGRGGAGFPGDYNSQRSARRAGTTAPVVPRAGLHPGPGHCCQRLAAMMGVAVNSVTRGGGTSAGGPSCPCGSGVKGSSRDREMVMGVIRGL